MREETLKIDKNHIEPISDEEQKEMEKILNNMSEDDKKIVSSKTITIEI